VLGGVRAGDEGECEQQGERILHHYHIPSFRYPERAIKSLSAYANWHTWRQAALAQSRHPMVQNHLKFETKKHIIQNTLRLSNLK
jgi:acyl-CoA synthetase (NDP forming)